MRILLNTLLSLAFLMLVHPHTARSQDRATDPLAFSVDRVFSTPFIARETLHDAQTLIDLNPHYKPSWVRNYISVETHASCRGAREKVVSKNDVLSSAQKDLISRSDPGTPVSVRILYMPENTLTRNDPQEMSFSFTIDPEHEAQYPGGKKSLDQYLQKSVIQHIPVHRFNRDVLAAVTFTIDETGEITDAHIFESSRDDLTDGILLDAIRDMPQWSPAKYANGTRVKQDFVFTIGNMESCVINLLNIRR